MLSENVFHQHSPRRRKVRTPCVLYNLTPKIKPQTISSNKESPHLKTKNPNPYLYYRSEEEETRRGQGGSGETRSQHRSGSPLSRDRTRKGHGRGKSAGAREPAPVPQGEGLPLGHRGGENGAWNPATQDPVVPDASRALWFRGTRRVRTGAGEVPRAVLTVISGGVLADNSELSQFFLL